VVAGREEARIELPNGTRIAGDGCFAEAELALYGSQRNLIRDRLLAEKGLGLQNEARAKLLADPRAIEATREWSECMRARGYDYATPADAGNETAELEMRDRIPVAVADVDCKAEVDLVRRLSTILAAYQQELLDRNPGLIEARLRIREEMLERARAILEGA
jgi:hypothetical protein